MIDKMMDLYHQYYDQITTWYNALDTYYQVVVLVISGVSVLLIIAFIHLSKITK